MTENFADHPKSITEIKSDRDADAAAWTPRDVLIALLRRIDSGEADPEVLVVFYGRAEGDVASTNYTISSPNLYHTLGVIERGKHMILGDAYTRK